MKKMRIFGMVCMAGLLAIASSCKKEDTKEVTSVQLSAPEAFVSNPADGERAYITLPGSFFWNANDELVVYNLSDQYAQSKRSIFHNVTGPGSTARFAGPSVGPRKPLGFRFFFPKEMIDWDFNGGNGDLANENREHFIVSEWQNYAAYDDNGHQPSLVDPDAMPMAIDPYKITDNCQLQHIFGVASIQMRADEGDTIYVKEVQLEDEYFNLWGTCSVKLHNVDTAHLRTTWEEYVYGDMTQFETYFAQYITGNGAESIGWESNGQGKTLRMDCVHKDAAGNDVYVMLFNEQGTGNSQFNFMVRPLACSHGIKVRVIFDDDTMIELNNWDSQHQPAALLKLKAIQPHKISAYHYGVIAKPSI
jgi:hypothetical protein